MLMFTAYLAVVVALYLVPLTISSPCIMEKKALGPKPAILGHRGAPMVSSDQSPVLWLLCPCEGCCWIWQSPGCSPGNGYNKYNFEALLPGITVKVKQGLNPESSDTPDALDTNKRASPALLGLVCAIVLFWLLLFIELWNPSFHLLLGTKTLPPSLRELFFLFGTLKSFGLCCLCR